ncbi:MAG TPA: O-antigen ligase family protein [Burkholderiales bacterium]
MAPALDHRLLLTALAALGALGGAAVALGGPSALILLATLIGCAFVLHDFRIGVVLLIVLMPLAPSILFPHVMLGVMGLNPLNLLLAGTLGACVLQGLAVGGPRRFLPRPLLWLYLAPILAAGALGTQHLGEIAPGLMLLSEGHGYFELLGYLNVFVVKPISLVLFALLVAAATARSARPERLLVPALVSVWVMAALVIGFVLSSGIALDQLASSESREFLSPLGLHANDLGRLFAVAYALLLFSWTAYAVPALRAVLLASMVLVAIAMMLTFSRGAFVAFLAINLLYVLWRRNAGALAFFGLLALAGLLLLPDVVFERASIGFDSGADAVSAGRIRNLWLPLLPETLRSPLYGNGLGSILWSEPMRRGAGVTVPPVMHPHNAYLQALLDMGIVGLALLCAYFVHVWRRLRALAADAELSAPLRGFFLGAAAALVAMLVSNITDSSLLPRPEHVYLWFAIGMMYGQAHERR